MHKTESKLLSRLKEKANNQYAVRLNVRAVFCGG